MNKSQGAESLEHLRHSAAHLLAHAVMELFPKTQLTIGPATTTGFFYDFLPVENFKEKDLEAIHKKMVEIAERNLPITQEEISKKEAYQLFKDNPFKIELLDGIEGDTVGLSRQGEFYDLCKGGHVTSTGLLKHTKLTNLSGSYWRADRNGIALQRINGVVFPSSKDLRIYEQQIEEAEKYDHRKLGAQLELFTFLEEGVGFPFYLPHGKLIINLLIEFLRKKQTAVGYQEIQTPVMLSDELWRRSGHYAHYKENMYFSIIDEKSYALKPMNCPGAILVYKNRPHSYRELPLKYSEFGLVHRHELSGVLHGLFRVRAFTQDDAHIFCREEQIETEVLNVVTLARDILSRFDFNTVKVNLSTRPAKAMGDVALWNKAEAALESALKKTGLAYQINAGDGAFYGPKIDFVIEDSMGRNWQLSTVQLDFFLPENFDLTYVAPGGERKRPVMIHRALYGSLERFFGVLLEHYKGKLPFWLCPIQIQVLTITDDQKEYATKICAELKKQGLRATIDESSEQISAKIKAAQLQQIPWMLVIGAKEQENCTITLRTREGKQEFGLTLEQIIAKTQEVH
jgi:threonyl-tRNA synthetase